MNWNEIEHLVNEHQELLEESVPEQHISRFEFKLKKRSHQRQRFLLRVAASIALFIMASGVMLYFVYHIGKPIAQYPEYTHNLLEFKETEAYYTSQVAEEMNHLKQLQFPDPTQKSIVLQELSLMDQNYKQLTIELEKNPGDERLMHGIIEQYLVKLDALNRIVTSLSYCQTNAKNKGHEQDI